MKMWKSEYLDDHAEDPGFFGSRLWYYTKVPFHYDRAWKFLRIWIFCWSWL